jgi:hypothetical protein
MITPELKTALESIKAVGGEDLVALAKWFRGEGRVPLKARGADDDLIGPLRIEIDRDGEGEMYLG